MELLSLSLRAEFGIRDSLFWLPSIMHRILRNPSLVVPVVCSVSLLLVQKGRIVIAPVVVSRRGKESGLSS